MHRYKTKTDPVSGKRYLPVSVKGRALIDDSILNKGTCFSLAERIELGLDGLLPPASLTIEQQLTRVYENYKRQPDDISRYLYLIALQDRNETLFYRLLREHVEEMTPIVYTPTVGLACQTFSHIFRKPRGLYITAAHTGRIPEVLLEAPFTGVAVIVATDSEGILGLGDLGAGGMGIPIGKLSLYTLGAGIHPARCLPICLDVGTNNVALRNDPIYLGVNQPRLEGDAYYALLDEFVEAVAQVFPETLLQWEDFSRQKAWTVLERYRDRVCSFNDDIQGTGAITLAGVHGVCSITGRKLVEHRFVVHGAGAGGGGIIHVLLAALEDAGLTPAESRARVVGLDSRGLILADRPGLDPFKQVFAADPALVSDWQLEDSDGIHLNDVVRNFKPTVLIGTSGHGGCFNEALVREMVKHVECALQSDHKDGGESCRRPGLDRWARSNRNRQPLRPRRTRGGAPSYRSGQQRVLFSRHRARRHCLRRETRHRRYAACGGARGCGQGAAKRPQFGLRLSRSGEPGFSLSRGRRGGGRRGHQ